MYGSAWVSAPYVVNTQYMLAIVIVVTIIIHIGLPWKERLVFCGGRGKRIYILKCSRSMGSPLWTRAM